MPMSLPLDFNKWQRPTHISPEVFLNSLKSSTKFPDLNNSQVMFSWINNLTQSWARKEGVERKSFLSRDYYPLHGNFIFTNFGIGAPALGVLLEESIALGATQFIGVGVAGAINPDLGPGDVVIADSALRDEGTSYHYLNSQEKWVSAPKSAIHFVESAFKESQINYKIGQTWTTDAPYRETKQEIIEYKKQGVLTVEMEASAFYAIAKAKGVEAVSIFVISDVLNEDKWEPHFYHKELKNSYEQVLMAISKKWEF